MLTKSGEVLSIRVNNSNIIISCKFNQTVKYTFKVIEQQPFEHDLSNAMPVDIDKIEFNGEKINISIHRYFNQNDRIYSKFKVKAENEEHEGFYLDGICYVTELNDISENKSDYPVSNTIKGLQVAMIEDALKLGVKHAALNLNLPTIALPQKDSSAITYIMDGEEFYFNGEYIEKFDKRVKELSDNGIIVTLILLNSTKWDGIEISDDLRDVLLHTDYNKEGLISAFNVKTQNGYKYYKAFLEFVAQRYMRSDEKYGRVCGFIVGNEIDSQWVWCNAGEKSVNEYMEEYCIALRTAYYASRKKYSQSRIYISLDHYWTMNFEANALHSYKGKEIIDILNHKCTEEGNFPWNVAYHPYPEDLNNPDFWNDKTATDAYDTGRITFKNIQVLPQYLSQQNYLYNGELRHIILSEQGFNSKETEESEKLQAAAYLLAYMKIEKIHGIDSFILHAHVDNRDEFGLNLGLWRRKKDSSLTNEPDSPKPIYYVFRDVDNKNRSKYFNILKEVINPIENLNGGMIK